MIPMCWKCVNKIEKADPTGIGLVLCGCEKEPEIKDYSDAQRLCPLLKEDDNGE